ncbi:MAG: MFS transporter [Gammaproteobacteria bacterium]|nr:MAG: MFS transporter [Gammaproteobacteria bacterium]
MMGLFMVLPLLTLYAGDFVGATPFLIGLALGVYGLMQAVLQIPLGFLSDRVGRKPVIIGGLLLFAAGSLIAAQADTIWGLLLGRVMQGAGAIAGTLMALVADLTRPEQRTKAMAIVGVSIGFSFMLAMIVGPLVAAKGGLSAVFELTAVLAVSGVLLLWLVVPTPDAPEIPQLSDGGMTRALLNPALLRLDFGVFILHLLLMAVFLLVPTMLEQSAGLVRESHWKVYLAVMLLSIVGIVPMMRVAERGGKSRAVFLLAISLLLPALLLLACVWQFAELGAVAVYVALWLFFVGFNFLEASMPSLVSKVAGQSRRGAAMGAFSTSQFLGAFCGGALGGLILQLYGAFAVLMSALSLVLVWLVVARTMQLAPSE